MNFRLLIEYDGTDYHGWQRQKNGRTIQGEIERALAKMTGQQLILNGSGRTDAGVHALGQVANFRCDTKLTPKIFQNGLNSLLNRDIVIRDCQQTGENFHARYDAKSKRYRYRILNAPIPSAIHRRYAWFIRKKLDTDAMRAAVSHIMGKHDFAAFEGAGSPRAHTIRSVLNANFTESDHGHLHFEIEADGFLRFMVRNIVGTLTDVGLGKLAPDDFRRILLSKDRNQAGITAPPHGLFLVCVMY